MPLIWQSYMYLITRFPLGHEIKKELLMFMKCKTWIIGLKFHNPSAATKY